ncbi:MAG: hypothetical protein ACLSHO_09595 [Dysosmobacter sp.]
MLYRPRHIVILRSGVFDDYIDQASIHREEEHQTMDFCRESMNGSYPGADLPPVFLTIQLVMGDNLATLQRRLPAEHSGLPGDIIDRRLLFPIQTMNGERDLDQVLVMSIQCASQPHEQRPGG